MTPRLHPPSSTPEATTAHGPVTPGLFGGEGGTGATTPEGDTSAPLPTGGAIPAPMTDPGAPAPPREASVTALLLLL